MSVTAISPDELRRVTVDAVSDYFARAGWRQARLEGGGLLFESPDSLRTGDGGPLTYLYPDSEAYADYPLRVEDLLSALSVIEDRPATAIWEDLVGGSRDVPSPSPSDPGVAAGPAGGTRSGRSPHLADIAGSSIFVTAANGGIRYLWRGQSAADPHPAGQTPEPEPPSAADGR